MAYEVRHVVTVRTAFFSILPSALRLPGILFGDEKRLEFSLISNGVFQTLLQSQAAFQPGFRISIYASFPVSCLARICNQEVHCAGLRFQALCFKFDGLALKNSVVHAWLAGER